MKKILVIEDNTEVRENLCEILELANYTTFQAENGKIGVQMAKDEHPDLILCDVMMPQLDGFGVLKIISGDPELLNTPFMFLTAKAEKDDFRKGMGLGADDYITKPFDEVELMEAIEMRLKKSDQLVSLASTDEERQFYNKGKAEQAFAELIKDKEIRKYEKKSTIYDVGQYPKYLYYILKGQVKVTQVADNGKELITKIFGEGDCFGFLPLIENIPYYDNVVCSESTEVLLIPGDAFKNLMFNDRDFNLMCMKEIIDHAIVSDKLLLDFAFSSVRKKVSKTILTYAEKVGNDKISISREDLAAMAGTARETVIRTLTDFKSEGLIDVEDGCIVLLNKNKLEKLPQ